MVYTLSREEAGKMLGVSTRTVDRHVQNGKIRTRREGKVVMLHEEDVKKIQSGGDQQDYEVIEPKPLTMPTIGYDTRESHNEIMHAIEKLLRDKDTIIQELTFKIGTMEGEVNNSVPRLEHKKTLLALEEAHHHRMNDMEIMLQAKKDLETKLKNEKFIATMLMIGIFVILIAATVLVFHFMNLQQALEQTI